jgi:ABC-type transport system involved in multi-copper enzyme maturation permease subunit
MSPSFTAVLAAEFLKLRRSKVTWLTLLAFALGPLGTGLFMWIVREPGRAADLGLIGAKADFLGLEATWPAYLAMVTQMIGIVGGLILAVITAYVFGREYAEGTARYMLALPIPRRWFVLSKLAVVGVWWFGLVGAILVEAALVAVALGLPAYSPGVLSVGVGDALLAAILGLALAPVVAWIATLGRGYLPPLGFAMLMLVVGNVLGATEWGQWFPWSIVPLFAGVAGPPAESLAGGSVVVVGMTGLVGLGATVMQMAWSDSPQ